MGLAYPNFEFKIKSYYNGQDFLREFDEKLDILLLDYYLLDEEEQEVITGNEIVDEVNKLCEDCRIIIISSQEDEHVKWVLRNKGIVDYIDKNLNSINRVGNIIHRMMPITQ